MLIAFIQELRAEWLKQKRSLALGLVLLGGLFVPGITLLIRLHRPENLPALYRSPKFWEGLWNQAWQPMAILLLPLAVILMTTLLVQIEYRNNAWKQVHAAPPPFSVIFAAKLTICLALLAALLLTFSLATWTAAALPPLLFDHVPPPRTPPPWRWLLARSVAGYVTMLPIVALQFLLGLRFRNFMVPLGAGVALWLASVLGTSWEFNWLLPYGYGGLDYLRTTSPGVGRHWPADIRIVALTAFALFTAAAYALYATRKDRG